MKVEWNPETHEVFVEGAKIERVAVFFVEGNHAPVAEWADPHTNARYSMPCEVAVNPTARETTRETLPKVEGGIFVRTPETDADSGPLPEQTNPEGYPE